MEMWENMTRSGSCEQFQVTDTEAKHREDIGQEEWAQHSCGVGRSRVYHAKKHQLVPLVTRGRAHNRSAEERLNNYFGSHTQ